MDIQSCLVGELRVPIFFRVYSIFVKLENQMFALVSSLGGGGEDVLRNVNHCTGHFRQIECALHYRVNSNFFIFLLFLPPGNCQLIGDCTLETS